MWNQEKTFDSAYKYNFIPIFLHMKRKNDNEILFWNFFVACMVFVMKTCIFIMD